MASSSSSRNFNVFLSFQGLDTRRTFVSHLRRSLDRKGIKSFDDENESDSSAVDQTIGECKVAVVLMSVSYASSPLCLDSLVKLLKFHQSGSLFLIPIFYEVDPLDVRKQNGKLHEAFSLHEIENPEKVQTWRQALSQLVSIPGGLYSEIWEGDAELIHKITVDVWDILVASKSSDLCGLVGMDRHIKAMYGLLDIGLKDEVRHIVIWGIAQT